MSPQVDGLTDLALESNGAPGVAFVDQVLGALSNMIADLILVYRLWIIMGDSKHRIWVAVPVATAVLGTGESRLPIQSSFHTNCFQRSSYPQ